jgi:hypothetical protein
MVNSVCDQEGAFSAGLLIRIVFFEEVGDRNTPRFGDVEKEEFFLRKERGSYAQQHSDVAQHAASL